MDIVPYPDENKLNSLEIKIKNDIFNINNKKVREQKLKEFNITKNKIKKEYKEKLHLECKKQTELCLLALAISISVIAFFPYSVIPIFSLIGILILILLEFLVI